MVQVDMLKDMIIENNMTIEGLAADMDINRSTLYRKFEKACEKMTIKEARLLAAALHIEPSEAGRIFFA